MEKWTLKKWDSPDYLDGIRTDLMIEKGKYEPVAYAFEEDQARLIAAAPELLEALDHPLLREVLGFIEDAAPDEVMATLRLWQDTQRAAITKATQP